MKRWIVASLCAWTMAASAGETVVLKAARWFDAESGSVKANAVIVVEDGKIRALGGAAPSGARVIDLGDVTLLPGLIDVHTHLTGMVIDQPGWDTATVRETAIDDALRGVKAARDTLQAGFTTVRDLGSRGFADVSLNKAIQRGDIIGPRMIMSGHALGITGGHCDDTGYAPGVNELGPRQGVADGADAVTQAVRYQAKHGATVIKLCATAGVLSFDATVGAQQMSDAELRAAVEEARRHGLRVAAHAHGAEGIKAAVRAGVTSIEHGSMLDDEGIALMKAKGTWLVPQAYLAEAIPLENLPPSIRAKAEMMKQVVPETIRKAYKAGLKIGMGTDSAVIPFKDTPRELSARVRLGIPAAEVLKQTTIYNAELLGLNDRGRLAPGTLADIIAVPGDPTKDIGAVEKLSFVMKGGAVVKP